MIALTSEMNCDHRSMTVRSAIFDLYGTLTPTISKASYDATLQAMAERLRVGSESFMDEWHDTAEIRVAGEYSDLHDYIALVVYSPRDSGSRKFN